MNIYSEKMLILIRKNIYKFNIHNKMIQKKYNKFNYSN